MLPPACFACVSAAACTNHVPVITTLLRGGETTEQVLKPCFIRVCLNTVCGRYERHSKSRCLLWTSHTPRFHCFHILVWYSTVHFGAVPLDLAYVSTAGAVLCCAVHCNSTLPLSFSR